MKLETISARVHAIRLEADGVQSYEFRRTCGGPLPAYDAGAHVELYLPNGLVRSYSLCGKPGDCKKYLVAVSREEAGRGGSKYMFDTLRPGQELEIGFPRNHFSLTEEAPHSALIAGGIGITPLWSMAQRLAELGRPWTLYYAARSAGSAAFLGELRALARSSGGNVVSSFGDDPARAYLDLAAIVATAPRGTHFYCCGPARMIDAFSRATDRLDPGQVHVEFFAGTGEVGVKTGFTVELARSQRAVFVEAGTTILSALEAAGVPVPSSCKEGVCASCETNVISGKPDHRDLVLSKAEKAANKSMMICCSGSLSERLVLDI